MPLEYAKTHQCVKCGLTRPVSTLKLARRIDDVMNVNETVFVCQDDRLCMRMKLERAGLLMRELSKPIVGKGGRPKKAAPLVPPVPVKRSKKTLQFFPTLAEARRLAGTKPPKRKRLDPPKEPR